MRQFLSLLILALLIGGVLFALAPEGRQTLDRVRINAMGLLDLGQRATETEKRKDGVRFPDGPGMREPRQPVNVP